VIDGFVLAGGRSRRMGVDKARLPGPDRWPLAVGVAGALRAACARVAIVRRGPADPRPWPTPWGEPLEVVREAEEGEPHPLWGVAAACAAARTPHLVVAPCDLVALDGATVQRLAAAIPVGGATGPAGPVADARGAAIAVSEDGEHPLLAVLPRALGPLAASAARDGASARAFFAAAARVEVPAAAVRNVNRWAEAGWPHPLAAVGALPGVGEAAVDGERRRLWERGCVLPPSE
jgi:molybdopterin-guanine dinucleotide biosynthesis protein A